MVYQRYNYSKIWLFLWLPITKVDSGPSGPFDDMAAILNSIFSNKYYETPNTNKH